MRRLCAVLGGDVSQSLSPHLHGAAAAALGLDVAYVPVSCPTRADFDGAVDALARLGALGANVTLPHKRAALERCDGVSETARAIGAVNTLTFAADPSASRIVGDNTDGPGMLAVLAALPASALARVQVLGAGGAARAVVWALGRAGAGEIVISARDAKGEVLAAEGLAGAVPCAARGLERVPGATLVVSTLPKEPALAADAVAAWVDVGRHPHVLDLAYAPRPGATPMVAAARARGLSAEDGLGLLVEQAARSLALWTGGEVSRIREAMRAAL